DGVVQAGEWEGRRLAPHDPVKDLLAELRKLVQNLESRLAGRESELVQHEFRAVDIPHPDPQMVMIPARRIEGQSRMDKLVFPIDKAEVDGALANDVDKAAVAGDWRGTKDS